MRPLISNYIIHALIYGWQRNLANIYLGAMLVDVAARMAWMIAAVAEMARTEQLGTGSVLQCTQFCQTSSLLNYYWFIIINSGSPPSESFFITCNKFLRAHVLATFHLCFSVITIHISLSEHCSEFDIALYKGSSSNISVSIINLHFSSFRCLLRCSYTIHAANHIFTQAIHTRYFVRKLIKYLLFSNFVKKTHSITQQEEQPITSNTHAQRGDHILISKRAKTEAQQFPQL
jgi:hypothetical protein